MWADWLTSLSCVLLCPEVEAGGGRGGLCSVLLGLVFTSSISDLSCFLKPKIEQNGSFCTCQKKGFFFLLQLFRCQ